MTWLRLHNFLKDVPLGNIIRHPTSLILQRNDIKFLVCFLWGHLWPMQKDSLGGASYYFLFKDDYLGYKFVYCIKNKFEALSCFKQLVV